MEKLKIFRGSLQNTTALYMAGVVLALLSPSESLNDQISYQPADVSMALTAIKVESSIIDDSTQNDRQVADCKIAGVNENYEDREKAESEAIQKIVTAVEAAVSDLSDLADGTEIFVSSHQEVNGMSAIVIDWSRREATAVTLIENFDPAKVTSEIPIVYIEQKYSDSECDSQKVWAASVGGKATSDDSQSTIERVIAAADGVLKAGNYEKV